MLNFKYLIIFFYQNIYFKINSTSQSPFKDIENTDSKINSDNNDNNCLFLKQCQSSVDNWNFNLFS